MNNCNGVATYKTKLDTHLQPAIAETTIYVLCEDVFYGVLFHCTCCMWVRVCVCAQRVVNTSFVQRASEQFFNVHCVHACHSLPTHVPLNVRHCIRRTVTVCIWEPLMLSGSACARRRVRGNKRAFQRMFVHLPCVRIPAPQRGGWGQRGWEWWVMPEVVFYQPLRRLAGSLMASSVGWLTNLLALSGSFFHIW